MPYKSASACQQCSKGVLDNDGRRSSTDKSRRLGSLRCHHSLNLGDRRCEATPPYIDTVVSEARCNHIGSVLVLDPNQNE